MIYKLFCALTLVVVLSCGGETGVEIADPNGTNRSDMSQPDAAQSDDSGSVEPGDDMGGRDAATAGDMQVRPDGSMPDPCESVDQRADTENPAAGVSWRYGGGHGYPDAIRFDADCMQMVSTLTQLENALTLAQAGDIIYIDDDARIDLSRAETVRIPGGVWLVSGRGVDGSDGALLYSTVIEGRSLIRAQGPDVRVTGLRLYGPDPNQCPREWPNNCTGDIEGDSNCRDCMPRPSGIRAASGADRLEVDNCELAGFSLAAVALSDSVGHRVHHNHIHHNQRQGLGYGVLLGRGSTGTVEVLVDWNRMDYMRHAIAGSGEPGQDYEARNNLVLGNANGHVFDMHGENENTDNGSLLAGGLMLIHQNTILPSNVYALVVRGNPDHGAYFFDNCIARGSAMQAVNQRITVPNTTEADEENVFIDEGPNSAAPNLYGRSGPQCETERWCMSAGASGPWRYLQPTQVPLENLRFGDFDGDGVDDVFRSSGGKWQWSRSGNTPWSDLNTSTFAVDRLAFGDFDGDGTTDVFNANGSIWRYSAGGSASWQTLRNTDETLVQLGFGDFDGDGATDAFKTEGGTWWWSRSASEDWAELNTSGVGLANLAFGDFDGDGRTDVFRTGGGTWQWSKSGSSGWQDLNTSGVGLSNLAFADVDGDGATDAVSVSREVWRYSSGASSPWQVLRFDSRPLASVAFGDFDGDGAADVFRANCLGD